MARTLLLLVATCAARHVAKSATEIDVAIRAEVHGRDGASFRRLLQCGDDGLPLPLGFPAVACRSLPLPLGKTGCVVLSTCATTLIVGGDCLSPVPMSPTHWSKSPAAGWWVGPCALALPVRMVRRDEAVRIASMPPGSPVARWW
eukprot:scaffold36556_cov62-Phaeocystis_antarctica.AAC.1